MPRTITVTGVGSTRVSPDTTVITMVLRSLNKDYAKSVAESAEQLEAVKSALCAVGFRKEDIKTTSFNIVTEHESVRDENGNYTEKFKGYSCINNIKLEFDFDASRLSDVVATIASSLSDPQINIRFTVRDSESVKNALLTDAAENARKKAEILASASGVSLGLLLSVDYSFRDRELVSRTEYMMDNGVMAMKASRSLDFTPDDISLSDSVTFVWEIK